MLGDTGLDDAQLDEITMEEADLELALARTKARHSQLVTRRKRRTTMLASLGALLVVGSVGLFALRGDDSSGVVTDLPMAADPAETTAIPSTTATPPVPPAEVGTAVVARRALSVESFAVDAAAGQVTVRLPCEDAGEAVTSQQSAWSGSALLVEVVVETDQPGQPCDGTPLEVQVPIPAGVSPDDVTVAAGRL